MSLFKVVYESNEGKVCATTEEAAVYSLLEMSGCYLQSYQMEKIVETIVKNAYIIERKRNNETISAGEGSIFTQAESLNPSIWPTQDRENTPRGHCGQDTRAE